MISSVERSWRVAAYLDRHAHVSYGPTRLDQKTPVQPKCRIEDDVVLLISSACLTPMGGGAGQASNENAGNGVLEVFSQLSFESRNSPATVHRSGAALFHRHQRFRQILGLTLILAL